MTGFLLIDKPADWTSHDAVAYLRRTIRQALGIKKIKIGHAGTLDPFATGLLIIGVGKEATKQLSHYQRLPKVYEATITLGATSDTQDGTGIISETVPQPSAATKEQIEQTLLSFLGKQEQLPPMYSAKKIQGKKLYQLARSGQEIERKPHHITIYRLERIAYQWPELSFRAEVSSGTYIRTLAHDIGTTLGVGAYCKTLRRTSTGPYRVQDAIAPTDITQENWQERLIPGISGGADAET